MSCYGLPIWCSSSQRLPVPESGGGRHSTILLTRRWDCSQPIRRPPFGGPGTHVTQQHTGTRRHSTQCQPPHQRIASLWGMTVPSAPGEKRRHWWSGLSIHQWVKRARHKLSRDTFGDWLWDWKIWDSGTGHTRDTRRNALEYGTPTGTPPDATDATCPELDTNSLAFDAEPSECWPTLLTRPLDRTRDEASSSRRHRRETLAAAARRARDLSTRGSVLEGDSPRADANAVDWDADATRYRYAGNAYAWHSDWNATDTDADATD